MQLLVRNTFSNFDTWKSVFDDDYEARMRAGLSVLQIWRDCDASHTVWLLYDVNDRGKALSYLEGDAARLRDERAGVTDSAHHFVVTL